MMEGRLRAYRREIFVCLLLAAMSFLVYGQMVHHNFINFDDETYLTQNFVVQKGLTWQTVLWAFKTTHANFWHPLTWLSHMLDFQLFKGNAGLHHLTNLLIHIASTILLFLFLRRSTGALWCGAVVAALFAVHPLHVESVAWASERKDTLSTFFWMLTMWCYVRYAERPDLKRYSLVLLAFVMGLMAKPMLVTLPFVLLLFDWWPLKRVRFEKLADLWRDKEKRGTVLRLILEKVPLLVLALAASVVAYIAQKNGGAIGTLDKYPMSVRIENALSAYVLYIAKTIWPMHLMIPYPHPGKIPLWQVGSALAILAGISVMVFRRGRKYPYLVVGWLWYLGTLLPVIGLIQVGYHALADRYTYIPLVGLFIITAWGVADISSRWHPRYKRTVLISLAGITFAFLTAVAWVQVGYWKNSIKLFEHSLNLDTRNLAAHNNLGTALLGKGDIKGGEFHFHEALKLDPNNAITHHNLGLSLYRQGKTEEAIKLYEKALKLNPRQIQTHIKLGDALLARGDLEGAIKHYSVALKAQPYDIEVQNNIGNAFMRLGKYDEAIKHYSAAQRLRPDASVRYNLGSALLNAGKIDEAITYLADSLRLDPNNAKAHNNLANALARRGDTEEAIIHYHEALRLDPRSAETHCNLGIVLKKQGKSEEAIEQFSEAIKIDPKFEKARKNLEQLQK